MSAGPPTKITVTPAKATVPLSGTVQLAPSLFDVNGNAVKPTQSFTYKSVNPSLASVSPSGLVTAASLAESGMLQNGGVVEVQISYPWGNNTTPGGAIIYASAYITVLANTVAQVDSYYSQVAASPQGVWYRQGDGGSIRPTARVVPLE